MMLRLVVLAFLLVISGTVLADEARQLRIDAAVLIYAAERVNTVWERESLLKEAYDKLSEIQKRYSPASAQIQLYFGGKLSVLTPNIVLRQVHLAALSNLDIGDLRKYLRRQPSPFEADENGWTDLHYAAALDLSKLAEALVKSGANVNAQIGNDGEPPSTQLHQVLDNLNVATNFTRQGYEPLHIAALNNALGVAVVLIENGADVHAKSEKGLNPLHLTALNNALEVAVVLIENGVDVGAKNEKGGTPLHYASNSNALEVAVELIENGADVHAKSEKGLNPLHLAAFNNALEVAVELIESGADVHAKNENGLTPLHFTALRNAAELAVELIENGADVDAKNENGLTPLHIVAHENTLEVAVVLIERGANIHAENNEGETPITIAVSQNSQDVLTVLKKRQETNQN